MTQPKARLGGEQYSGDSQQNKSSGIGLGNEQYNTPQSQGQSQGNSQGQQNAAPGPNMDQYNKAPAAGSKSND